MKKIFISLIFLYLIFQLPILANEYSSYGGDLNDLMQHSDSIDNAFEGQKKINDEEFQKTLEQLKAKQKKKNKDKTMPKGKSFYNENDGSYIEDFLGGNILLSVPVDLINGDGAEIPAGHYKIIGKKEGNDIYLNFYQSSTLIAKVPAIETKNDFNKMNINFIELSSYNEQRVKIIFGSMDFNAYTFIRLKNEISN